MHIVASGDLDVTHADLRVPPASELGALHSVRFESERAAGLAHMIHGFGLPIVY